MNVDIALFCSQCGELPEFEIHTISSEGYYKESYLCFECWNERNWHGGKSKGVLVCIDLGQIESNEIPY